MVLQAVEGVDLVVDAATVAGLVTWRLTESARNGRFPHPTRRRPPG
jgi:hypothetical protein